MSGYFASHYFGASLNRGREGGAELDTVRWTLGTLTGHPEDYNQVPTLSYGSWSSPAPTEPQRRDEELGEESLLLAVLVRSSGPDARGMPRPIQQGGRPGGDPGHAGGTGHPGRPGVLPEELGGADGGKDGQLLPRPRERPAGRICNLICCLFCHDLIIICHGGGEGMQGFSPAPGPPPLPSAKTHIFAPSLLQETHP